MTETVLDTIRRLEASLGPGQSAVVGSLRIECWERPTDGRRVFVCSDPTRKRREPAPAVADGLSTGGPDLGLPQPLRGFLGPHSEREEIAR